MAFRGDGMGRKKHYQHRGRPSVCEKEGLKILVVELDEVFDSYGEAAKRIGGNKGAVYACLRGTGNRKNHMGYTFKFV